MFRLGTISNPKPSLRISSGSLKIALEEFNASYVKRGPRTCNSNRSIPGARHFWITTPRGVLRIKIEKLNSFLIIIYTDFIGYRDSDIMFIRVEAPRHTGALGYVEMYWGGELPRI